MNSMAPDLSVLAPYMIAVIAVALVGAVVPLTTIEAGCGHVASWQTPHPRPRGPTASWLRRSLAIQ